MPRDSEPRPVPWRCSTCPNDCPDAAACVAEVVGERVATEWERKYGLVNYEGGAAVSVNPSESGPREVQPTGDSAVAERDDLIGRQVEWEGARWTVALAQHDKENERDRGHWHLTLTNPTWAYPKRLVTHVVPAYCASGWVQVQVGGLHQLIHVNSVERLERATETSNGRGACLWHVEGYPHPWFFANGHTHVSAFTEDRGHGD